MVDLLVSQANIQVTIRWTRTVREVTDAIKRNLAADLGASVARSNGAMQPTVNHGLRRRRHPQ
jgi:hypothetical protein